MKINGQQIRSSSLLAGATGIGSVGAAIFGIGGAVVGSLVGFIVGYWAEVESKKSTHHYQPSKGKKAHV